MSLLMVGPCCRVGRHQFCSGGKRPPKGYMGGWRCTCECHKPKVDQPRQQVPQPGDAK